MLPLKDTHELTHKYNTFLYRADECTLSAVFFFSFYEALNAFSCFLHALQNRLSSFRKAFAMYSSTPGVQAPPALAHDAGELEEYFAIEKCVSWRTIHDKEEGDHELYLFEVARTC